MQILQDQNDIKKYLGELDARVKLIIADKKPTNEPVPEVLEQQENQHQDKMQLEYSKLAQQKELKERELAEKRAQSVRKAA